MTLYHGDNSVCSQKVRLALAEKGLDWKSNIVDLKKAEQFAPEYLVLNPEGEVPTLVHDDFVLRESSVIIEYLDGLSDKPKLMPDDSKAAAKARIWLVRCIKIHEAVNSLSFASYIRDGELARRSADEIERWLASTPNPQIEAKRRELMARGPESVFVGGAIRTFSRVFEDMDRELSHGPYLNGPAYGMADTALTAYIDRLHRLAFEGLWAKWPRVGQWLDRMKARPSYRTAIAAYVPPEAERFQRQSGEKAWGVIATALKTH
nr:glutathione S-transferase family protein [Rhizobium sp. L1K21]